jgi:hypothetical protein
MTLDGRSQHHERKQIVKDRCPGCGHRFGLRGAPFSIPAKGGDSRKPVYYCGACGIGLKRIVPASERMVSVIGYTALLTASSISLWQMAILSQVVDRDWLLVFYGFSVVGTGVSIAQGLTRQHCYAHSSQSMSVPYQAEVSKASE